MRKLLCSVLILIICCFSLDTYAEDSNTTNNTTNNTTQNSSSNVTDLQKEQEELKSQIEQSEEELDDVQEELSENLQQVQKLDEKIQEAETQIEELETQINKLTETSNKLEEKLEVATESYEKQKKLLEARLIAMYESGETQYLDVILSSSSMSDFLSNYVLITEIAEYDTELLEEVENKKQIIETATEMLNTNLEQVSTMKENQVKTSKILQNTKTLRQSYISKLTTQEQEIQAKIDEYTTSFAAINKEILEISTSEGLETEYIGGVMAWPVPGYTQITSNYGMRTHPITGVYKLHSGVDISAPIGANFVAANDGIVTKACYNSAYGNMVMIDHGGGISTLYAHGSEILVEVGQTVTRGEAILKVGSTGYSTGPHAHFEVRINGEVTNPIEYITTSKIPESTTTTKDDESDEEQNTTEQNTTE